MSAGGPGPGPGAPGEIPVCYRHPQREAHIRCQRCGRPICPDCMRPASVGFQCPECVSEGAKQTRQLQGPYGGTRSANPALTSIVLIGLNVAVWALILLSGAAESRWVEWLGLAPEGRCTPTADPGSYYPGVLESACTAANAGQDTTWFPGVADGAWWQPLTSMFTHVQVFHIGFNMLALWVLGPQLEMVIGRARFLALYLLSGLAGSAAVLWLTPSDSQTIGASGAIFGLIAGLLLVSWRLGGNFQQLLLWLGINLVITFTLPGVSWQGHLGGLVGGAVVAALLIWAPRQQRAVVQYAGAAVLFGLIVAAIALRALTLAP